jgi:hypothetical protein
VERTIPLRHEQQLYAANALVQVASGVADMHQPHGGSEPEQPGEQQHFTDRGDCASGYRSGA